MNTIFGLKLDAIMSYESVKITIG